MPAGESGFISGTCVVTTYVAGMETTYRLVRTSIYLSGATLAKAKLRAAQQNVTVSHLIRAAMERFFASHRPMPRGGFLP